MSASEHPGTKIPSFANRQLSGNHDGRFGHRPDRHLFEFIAEKRPIKFRFLEADGRHRVLGAPRRLSSLGTFNDRFSVRPAS